MTWSIALRVAIVATAATVAAVTLLLKTYQVPPQTVDPNPTSTEELLQAREREEQRRKEEEFRKREQERLKREQISRNKRTRLARLNTGQKQILFHQTHEMAALEIKRTGRMVRGSSGMAGGGIYFATKKLDTVNKAQQKGYMVHARVKLGKIKTISANGDKSITFHSLLEEGYDSVEIPRVNGVEYVVYNYDQVEVLEVKKKKWRSKW